jgi:hypothetical protein
MSTIVLKTGSKIKVLDLAANRGIHAECQAGGVIAGKPRKAFAGEGLRRKNP